VHQQPSPAVKIQRVVVPAEPVWPAPLLLASLAAPLLFWPLVPMPPAPDAPVALLPLLDDFPAWLPDLEYDFAFGCASVCLPAALPSDPLMLSCVLLADVPLVFALPAPDWAKAKLAALARMAAAMKD
jgi:hypothetical protein